LSVADLEDGGLLCSASTRHELKLDDELRPFDLSFKKKNSALFSTKEKTVPFERTLDRTR